LKERDEIIKELETQKKILLLDKQTIQNNVLSEKYEKQSLAKDQKQLQEKYDILNERYEQLKQQEIINFSNLKKEATNYKNKFEDEVSKREEIEEALKELNDEKAKIMKEGEDNMSEYIRLENSIKDYQKQIEEKEQQLNQINNTQIKLLKEGKELENNYNLNILERDNAINKLQEERKKVEDILKVVNEEKEKLKEEGDKNFVDRIKYKRENEEYQKELEERKELENKYNLNITEKGNTIDKLNIMLAEKQKELELEKKK
jgi:hypothetical protein